MRWFNDLQARELLTEGWRRYSCVIQTRRGEIQRNLDRFIQSAYRAIDGYDDAVDDMRQSYRNMQLFARMLGELMTAVREVHRERGTVLKTGELRTSPLPPAPAELDVSGFSVPLVAVRWLPERPEACNRQSVSPEGLN